MYLNSFHAKKKERKKNRPRAKALAISREETPALTSCKKTNLLIRMCRVVHTHLLREK